MPPCGLSFSLHIGQKGGGTGTSTMSIVVDHDDDPDFKTYENMSLALHLAFLMPPDEQEADQVMEALRDLLPIVRRLRINQPNG
jgi:hypothetical protein